MKLLISLVASLALAATMPTTTQQIPAPNGTPITANVYIPPSGQPATCRLVYGGGKVLSLFMSTGITRTVNSLFVASAMAECQAEVTALKLTPLPTKTPGK